MDLSQITPAPIPLHEAMRIEELHDYQILDSESHRSFDELTSLAADLCEVPVALITFIDEKRQWCKSQYGLIFPETPREISFCAHTINSTNILIVEDTHHDARFANNPIVQQEPFIRFYVGAPLVTKKGLSLGALCVMDYVPRQLSPKKLQQLQILARQVMDQLDSYRHEKKAEKEQAIILESSRLAALGEMAGEIAHEINNPLTIIQANTAILMQRTRNKNTTDKAIIEYCEKILNVATRITKIIKGVKNLSRQADGKYFVTVVLDDLIQDSLGFCREKFTTYGIYLHYTAISKGIKISCHPVQISQVLLNLLNNSFDAISQSHLEKWIRIDIEVTDFEVIIRVVDSGEGISPEVESKMFDSFFTTKEIGKGTGLGLSISKGIINNHKGSIGYDRSQKNTCIYLKLPRV